uniref:Uncharacterized protein n=1 Tax=Romanomermis culicivorax TaxID=13658 RepID=A0A915J8N6_ROMCU
MDNNIQFGMSPDEVDNVATPSGPSSDFAHPFKPPSVLGAGKYFSKDKDKYHPLRQKWILFDTGI